ncbi:hypothetical protein [Cryptosporangium phraense]|uniref:Uncharacterized protein n=1 Tax=Cryptosporangium phraense TaxID=2593070 RepID=A0A545AYY4_9ACTN|nr:hypothetical protein [Cryptosporangium phraense]TQS46542.1 hypothetical protein FL583_03945 [Cryptosporangium phraense]
MILALLLDFANIAGGLLLASVLLERLPRVGSDLGLASRAAAPYGWIVGLVALVCGGYYLLLHVTEGPHVFHFEIVGIAVGVALLWNRLRPRPAPSKGGNGAVQTVAAPAGLALLLAVFGIIAVIVGFQGLLTPDY